MAEDDVVSKTDVTIQTDLPLRAEADSNGEAPECLTSPEPVISSSNDEPCVTPVTPAPPEVDISGLELLYKSIEQLESIESSRQRPEPEPEPDVPPPPQALSPPPPSPPLRGLGLLCALAEQRFQEISQEEAEESVEPPRPIPKPIRDLNRNYRTPKSEEDVRRFLAARQEAAQPVTHPSINLTMAEDSVEAEVRRRMAELQRTYKETQRELHRLTPRKYSTDGESSGKRAHSPSKRTPTRNANAKRKKQSSRKRQSSHKPEILSDPPPPVLERVTDVTEAVVPKHKWSRMDAPPTLIPHKPPPCKLNLIKLPAGNNQKRRWSVDSPSARSSIDSQLGDNLFSNGHLEEFDSQPSDVMNGNRKNKTSDDSQSTYSSSSKRRKVGRPKKHLDKAGSGPHSTETIVAKQPRNKASLVSFLLASKTAGAPGKFPSVEHRAKENLKSPIPSDTSAQSPEHRPKIRPKLKAEVKVKETWEEDDILDWTLSKQPLPSDPLRPINQVFGSSIKSSSNGHDKRSLKHDDDDVDWLPPAKKPKCITPSKLVNIPQFSIQKPVEKINSSLKVKKPVVLAKDRRLSVEKQHLKKPVCSSVVEEAVPKLTSDIQSFYLTPDLLTVECLPVRTLSTQGGLFYAGQVKALHPPDLYNIILDGDRHKSRPAVYSREEILRDTILEVRAPDVEALAVGTRICAYWSQQTRCLYPGTVASPSTPDPELDGDFVTVEFDDGDSGRIRIQDIRLLPPDYPIVENDPNPLLSLTKRRRRNSSTSVDSKDRRTSADSLLSSNSPSVTPTIGFVPTELSQAEAIDQELGTFFERAEVPSDTLESASSPTLVVSPKVIENESRRLKKRRREKLMRLMTASAAAASSAEVRKHKHKHRHHKHKHKHRHSSGSSSEATSKSDVELQPPDMIVAEEPISETILDLQPEKDVLTNGFYADKENGGNQEIKSEVHEEVEVDVKENEKEETKDIVNINGEVKDEENVKKKEKVKRKVKDVVSVKKKIKREKLKNPKKLTEVNGNKIGKIRKPRENKPCTKKPKKKQERLPSCETSKMAPFLPPKQLWSWSGKGHKKPGAKGRGKKEYFKCIQREKEIITVGDCAVFLSTNSPERPYIGRIESLWETYKGNMVVRVKWFYHPEETKGCQPSLKYPGGLFQSDHLDDNDVQTISHRCEVLQLGEYEKRLDCHSGLISQIRDVYYLAGFYNPSSFQFRLENGVEN